MLARAATRIELSRENDWDELADARRALELRRIEQIKRQ
jgi:hypothetical protein